MEIPYIHKTKIVVIGSCNTDMVVKANRLPVPGETILGGSFFMNPGVKVPTKRLLPPDSERMLLSYLK